MNTPITKTALSRIAAKTVRSAKGCWDWLGAISNTGYPQMTINGKTIAVHRFIAQKTYGSKASKLVMHKCDNKSCINPKHLHYGTPQQNMSDMVGKGRSIKGSNVCTAKLNKHSVANIRRMRQNGLSIASIAKSVGVNESTVSRVLSGKTWKHCQTK